MKQAKEITLETINLRIAARQWGNPDGERVLALHGWLDNAGSFDHLAPLLDNVNLVAIDLPGHGLSGHIPAGFHYQLADAVQTVMNVAASLKWSHFTLMGHSLGACIASLIASSFPQAIGRLILIDGIGPIAEDFQHGPQRLARSVDNMLKFQPKPPRVYPTLDKAIEGRQQSGHMSAEAARPLVLRGTQAVPGGLSWQFDRKLLLPSPTYFTERQVLYFMQQIACATLFIEAEDGLLQQFPVIAERRKQIAKLTHALLPGGHHLHLEDAPRVAHVINTFLTQPR